MDNPQDCPLIEQSASSYTDDEEENTDGVEDYETIVCGFTGDDNTWQRSGRVLEVTTF